MKVTGVKWPGASQFGPIQTPDVLKTNRELSLSLFFFLLAFHTHTPLSLSSLSLGSGGCISSKKKRKKMEHHQGSPTGGAFTLVGSTAGWGWWGAQPIWKTATQIPERPIDDAPYMFAYFFAAKKKNSNPVQ